MQAAVRHADHRRRPDTYLVMERYIMWITVVVALVLLVSAVGLLYWLLRSMGESGIEAAAPGSCRSGKCGVTPNNPRGGCASAPPADTTDQPLIDEIARKDARSPNQIL